ncbi:tryptophan--tRNA ligase [Ramlibacter albus]|uniref:Tryptophan--tRNA ligase n=1 Tax=Ramlibacter albus TaxID=2079448 RepID=A0A923MF75_9BURK|nr:tryptophan--tRNA ligase [Ramlibacter albus]MBC5767897.1 tryptophan--tRNA ligase [Ramlibacter albus]
MTTPIRYLTGITTSGTPHLGNYVGAMRPTVQASRRAGTENFYFLADYHSLIKCDDPQRIQRSTLEIAATWLAVGLDPDKVFFYRQSDIPGIPELTWLLTCVTGKGLLNRAHAYKAAVDKNTAAGTDPDADVTAGLFMYPVLMAADILLFKANKVPVGRDQVQHIEMARDMASSFNHLYGEHLVLPEAEVDDNVALLPGLDGRKMSKSYDNVIALFAPREQMRKQIFSIVTDSRAPGEPKETEGSALYQIFRAFASDDEAAALKKAFADGIAWSDAKQAVFERIDRELAPMREKYDHYMAHPGEIEQILQAGGAKARERATPYMAQLREAVGLRNLSSQAGTGRKQKASKSSLPAFKQYREADGKFYFKLAAADGKVLLQSKGFDSPKEAGQLIARLRAEPSAVAAEPMLEPLDAQAAAGAISALQELTADPN